MVNFEVTSCNSFRDIEKNHFVTAAVEAYMDNSNKQKCIRVSLKNHIHGQRFSTDHELKSVTEKWLKRRSELSYFTSIYNLQDHYKLCTDKGGV